MDSLRVVEVFLPAALIFVPSHAVQRHVAVQSEGIECLCVEGCVILGNLLDPDAAHTAHCIRKIFVDKLFFQPDRLEDLRALVGLDRRDPHLGSYLDDAVDDRAVVVIYRRIVILVQESGSDELVDGLVGQVRIDRAGAVSEERREVMHFSRLAALQDHGHGCPFLRAHQVLLETGHSEQGRDRHMVLVHLPVCQDQDVRALADHTVHFHEQILQSFLKAGVLIVSDRDLRHLEPFHFHIFDLQEICIRQDRIVHPEHLTVLFFFLQKVPVLAHIDHSGGHDLLADRVDGRVRHLGEKLFEISEQRLTLL